MFELPPLDQWTYETIRNIVERQDFEPGAFDFKEALHGTSDQGEAKAKLLHSIRKTVCAMANAKGGYILFGIRDKAKIANVEDRLCGIPRKGDHRKDFGDKLSALEPVVDFDCIPQLIPHPTDPDKGFLVVFIPRSSQAPHMFEFIFWQRTEGGSAQQMSARQISDKIIAREKEAWMREHAAATEELLTRLMGGVALSKGPAQAFDWNVDESTFQTALIEQLRSKDFLPVQLMVEKLPSTAATLLKEGEDDEFGTLLDRLTLAASLAVRLGKTNLVKQFVHTLTGVYRHCDGRKRLNIATRIMALGAAAVRLGHWRAARSLSSVSVKNSRDEHMAILSDALQVASDARQLEWLPQVNEFKVTAIPDALSVIEQSSWLRPVPFDDQETMQDSLCQFDALSLLQAWLGAGRNWYRANFAHFYQHRTEPLLVKLISDKKVRARALPCSDAQLAEAIQHLLQATKEITRRYMTIDWDDGRFRDERILRFLELQAATPTR